MTFKESIKYPDRDGVERTTEVERDLKNYIKSMETDVHNAYLLYDLISFSLYMDPDAWKYMDKQAFREEILRNFYSEEGIKNIFGDKNE
jgi:hypothetical protein